MDCSRQLLSVRPSGTHRQSKTFLLIYALLTLDPNQNSFTGITREEEEHLFHAANATDTGEMAAKTNFNALYSKRIETRIDFRCTTTTEPWQPSREQAAAGLWPNPGLRDNADEAGSPKRIS